MFQLGANASDMHRFSFTEYLNQLVDYLTSSGIYFVWQQEFARRQNRKARRNARKFEKKRQ